MEQLSGADLVQQCQSCPAAKFTAPDSLQYYSLASKQVFVDTINKFALSEEGKALYFNCVGKVSRGEVAGVINPYCMTNERSGMWFPDRNNDHYNGESARLHTYNNVVVHGILARSCGGGSGADDDTTTKSTPIITSAIVMRGLAGNSVWILTYSGSLYLLENRESEEEIILAFNERSFRL